MNGAQLAGSWAVRETFVAVVTTNLPMLSPLIQSALGAIQGDSFRSWLGSRRWGSGKGYDNRSTRTAARPGSIRLQDVDNSKQRGRDPKSLYHITALSESEERIMGVTGQSLHEQMMREREEALAREAQRRSPSQLGGIQQQVEVTVTREPSTLSAMEMDRRQMLGYVAQSRAGVGTSAVCQSGT